MSALDTHKQKLELLTQSERECLHMVAQHMRSKEIARQRGTSPYTVNRQIENAIKKLGAVDRHDAARIWLSGVGVAGIPNDSAYEALGMDEPAVSGSFREVTETTPNEQSYNPSTRHHQLHLEAARRAPQGFGGDAGTGRDGPAPSVGTGQAIPLSGRDSSAQRDHEDGGLRGRSGLYDVLSGKRSLSNRSWVVIFTLSAFFGAILLAGMLSAVSASFGLISAITHR